MVLFIEGKWLARWVGIAHRSIVGNLLYYMV